MAFQVLTLYDHVEDTDILEEHIVPVIRIEVCKVRLDYIGRLEESYDFNLQVADIV